MTRSAIYCRHHRTSPIVVNRNPTQACFTCGRELPYRIEDVHCPLHPTAMVVRKPDGSPQRWCVLCAKRWGWPEHKQLKTCLPLASAIMPLVAIELPAPDIAQELLELAPVAELGSTPESVRLADALRALALYVERVGVDQLDMEFWSQSDTTLRFNVRRHGHVKVDVLSIDLTPEERLKKVV